MLHAKLDPVTGRLSEIWDREPGAGDVPLAAMPDGDGPWIYDAVNRVGLPATLTEPERLDRVNLPRRVQAALVLRASSLWAAMPTQRRTRIMEIIDQYAQQIIDHLT